MNNAVRIGWQGLSTASDWDHILFAYLSGWLPPPRIATASQTRALLCTPLIKFLKLVHLLQQCLSSVLWSLTLVSELKGQVYTVVCTTHKAMSTFGYRRELSKYEELDEDELLASLTAEELQELEKELGDIEPDDKVPIGLRQRDQTVKTPTGTFSREALLKYWEKETRQILENERIGSSSPQVSNRSEQLYQHF